MFNKLYILLRSAKWNIKITLRLLPYVINIWSFLIIRQKMGPRTAYLKGGGVLYLRNYHDVQILLEIFENTYNIENFYKNVADIGANIGIFSVFYARKFPDSVIEAFEPEPNNFDLLLKNTKPYLNIHCHNKAIGSEVGETTLYLDRKNLGRHSIHESWVRLNGSVNIKVQKLTKEYDLIKIDTEGAEYDILKTIPSAKRIVMEIHEIPGQDSQLLIDRLSKVYSVTDLGGHVFSLEALSA